MKKLKIPFVNKKTFKKRMKKCYICGENKYKLLDVHRINEGQEYSYYNCVCLCVSCHRKHTTHLITIKSWVHSTKGRLLHYIDEDGKEQFK